MYLLPPLSLLDQDFPRFLIDNQIKSLDIIEGKVEGSYFILQLDSPVLKSHLKRRLSLLDLPLSRPPTVDILVGRVLPNLDFAEIGFCFLATGRVVGLFLGLKVGRVVGLVVDLIVGLVGLVVGLVVGRVAGLAVVVVVGLVVGLVVLLVNTGAGAGLVAEGGFLCGARGMLGLEREELEAAETGKVKKEMRNVSLHN